MLSFCWVDWQHIASSNNPILCGMKMCCRGSLLWSDKMVRKLTFGHWDWFIKSGRDYLRKFAVKFVILSRHYYYFNELLCLILILQCLKVKLLYNNTFEYKSSKCNIGQLPRVSKHRSGLKKTIPESMPCILAHSTRRYIGTAVGPLHPALHRNGA